MADTPETTLDEFTILGELFPGYFNAPTDFTYQPTPEPVDAGSGGGGEPDEAFAPPVPEVLPEVIVQPKPPVPVPPVRVPLPLSPLIPLFGLIIPTSTGTGADLPSDFAIRDNQFRPPGDTKKPPGNTGDELPPNWRDLADPGDKTFPNPFDFGKWLRRIKRTIDLFDWFTDQAQPLPTGPEVFPDPEIYEFVVSPQPQRYPQPDPTLNPSLFPVPGGTPFDFPLAYPNPGLAPSPRPGSTPAPGSTPRGDPFPADPFPLPRPNLRPDAPGTARPIAPDVFSPPLPDVIGYPTGDFPLAPPRPTPTGGNPAAPDFIVTGVPELIEPFLADPDADLPLPPGGDDPCNCKKEKKKKRKKPKPRTICYRGTYRQNTRGITYKKLEQVPCEPSSSAGSRKRTSSPAGFPGLSLTGGQVVELGAQAIREFTPIIEDYVRRKLKTKPKSKKRNRKAKTKPGRIPGTIYTSPFPGD